MHQKKVIRILETFDEREWRSCYKYLKYCSKKDAQSLKVFEYVYKIRKNLASPKLQSSVVRRKVLPKVTDRAFLNVLSELVKDIEIFMINYELIQRHRSYDRKKILADIYKKKGLYRFFMKTTREVMVELESADKIDLYDDLKWLEIHHSIYFSDFYDKNLKPIESLARAERRLALFANNLKLFYESASFNYRVLFNDQSPIEIDEIRDPLSQVVEDLHKLTTKRDIRAYERLELKLLEDHLSMSDELCQAIIIVLMNHCYFLIKSGDSSVINNLAELNIFGMKSGFLLPNTKLSETRFLNIIDTISKSEVIISLEKLIPDWIKKVNSQNIVSVEQMAYALWAFGRKEYGKTLQILNNSDIRLTHRNLSLRARWLYICSLCSQYPDYEGKDEVVKSSLAFFKRHEHEMNKQTYKGSINLVSVVKMIWDEKEVSVIQEYVHNCDFIMFKSWIDQFLEDMK